MGRAEATPWLVASQGGRAPGPPLPFALASTASHWPQPPEPGTNCGIFLHNRKTEGENTLMLSQQRF